MLYVAHAYEPSAILQAVPLPSFLPTTPCLALIKHSSIDFLSLGTDHANGSDAAGLLEPVQSVTLHARILAAQAVDAHATTASPTQTLLVLTDHHRPRLIALAATTNPDNGQVAIETTATLALDEVARTPAETALSVWVEPRNPSLPDIAHRVALSHVYKGVVKVVPLSSALAPSRSDAAEDADHDMEDAFSSSQSLRHTAHFSHSFGARLPHPNLLACALLTPLQASSLPSVALLSLSSVPSKIPGFGEQCLPVLSFHAIDASNQSLSPLPWGPPRKPPRASKDQPDDSQSSSAAGQASRDIKNAQKDDKSSSRKKHGPAAMGAKLDANDLCKREEDWAKTELAQCHVPLPFADAVGAHFVHALPAHVGGGVLVFSENSILHVPPPANPPTTTAKADSSSSNVATDTVDLKGKRRKASIGGAFEPRRQSSGNLAPEAPPRADEATTSSTPSNENGKRRRSSANAPPNASASPSKASSSSHLRPRLLRISIPHPVQVISAVNLEVEHTSDRSSRNSTFSVAFGCSSGALNLLRLTLPDASENLSSRPLQPKSMKLEHLGTTSQPSGPHSVSYLGDGLLCVSSATGDSAIYRIQQSDTDDASTTSAMQLVTPPSSPTQARRRRSSQAVGASLDDAELSSGGTLTKVEQWQNLGPVVDFVVDDGAGGDPSNSTGTQARIVTCSGAGPSGSIRELRTGASIQEFVSLPIPNAQHIWPVHAGNESNKQTVGLLAGFATSTAYLHFRENGDLADATDRLVAIGVDLSVPTLSASSVLGDPRDPILLHASGTEASLVRCSGESMDLLHQWKPPAGVEITAAAANTMGQLILALGDKSLCCLAAEGGALVERNRVQLEHEASCLDVSALVPGTAAQLVACGFWKSRTVQVFSLPELAPVGQSTVVQQRLSAVPRSILLHRFASKQSDPASAGESKASLTNRDALTPHLLVGLGDGTLVSFALSLPNDESFSRTVGLSDTKTISLGSKALKLDAVETSAGARAVAVSGSRPTLIFADSKRFSYSAIKYRDQRGVSTLYAGAGRTFNLLALTDSVELVSIGKLRKSDIRTIPLDLDQPLAITQWAGRRIFAVCTWTFLPQGSSTKIGKSRGAVRILDQATFELLDEMRLEADERPNCVTVLRVREHEMLVVGTGYTSSESNETTRGRLVGFDVASGSSRFREERGRLRKLFEHAEDGNVYSVKSINDRLAVAVNSEVKVYSVVDPRPSETQPAPIIKVRQRGSWASSFIACNLSVVEPDRIIVGDALRSMNVLHVHPYTARVTEIARDCDPFWTSATEMLDDTSQTYIGADIAFNLYTTQRVPLSDEVKDRIRRAREREMERGHDLSADPRTLRDGVDQYAHVMKRRAVWHYGDMINKFARTSLVQDPGSAAAVRPQILFCTASGGIGVIAHVRDEEARLLAKVERNIVSLVECGKSIAGVVGNVAHSDWRTLRTGHRVQAPAGFLDANILQMFVDGRLTREQRERVVQGPNSEVEAVGAEREVVEQLIEALSQVC